MPNIKKILQISTNDNNGGAERISKMYFQKYQALGYQSWMMVGRKFSKNPMIWELSNAASSVHFWSRIKLYFIESFRLFRQNGVRGTARIQSWLRLMTFPTIRKQHREGYEDFNYPGTKHLVKQLPDAPDIIHCHNLHGYYFDLRALEDLSQQYPVVLQLHDNWLLTGHCAYAIDCERWRSGCGQCPRLDTYPAISNDKSAENWLHKQAIYANSQLYVLTNSQWIMDKVKASMLQPIKARVIPNGVDLSIFHPTDKQAARRSLNLPTKARIVLFTAHTVFKDDTTMKRVLEGLTGENLLFVCIGKKGVSQKLGQGQLHVTGYINGADQMAQYYRAADIYLHIAKADTFPTTVLESLACGTPVVATAIGGIPEQIKHQETGYLVTPNNLEGVTASLQNLLDDESLRMQMSQAAATDAQQRFDLNKIVKDTLEWYQEVKADWQIQKKSIK